MQKIRINGARAERRGGAMVFVLFFLVSFITLGLAYGITARSSQGRVTSWEADQRAMNLAEAAVAESITALSKGMTGSIGSQAAPAYLDQGVLWVQATNVGGEVFRLQAVGMQGSGRAALDVHVERIVGDPLFFAVLNSREQLTLNADVTVDSFDSTTGTYASQAVNSTLGRTHAGTDGDVSSNEGIVMNANAVVLGDATPGPGYGVSMATGTHVSGSIAPSAVPFSFPPIVVPSTPLGAPMNIAPGSTSTLPAGAHGATSITIGKNATLIVQGPAEIVVDDFTGGKDASLIIDATNGPVTFFVNDTYTHLNGFEAQPATGSPMAVAFQILGHDDIVFPSSTRVRGGYYAPNADITFTSANEAWGAFAGNRVDMSSTMQFHYDEALASYWKTGSGAVAIPVELISWTDGQIPAAFRSDRRDPFTVLGVAPLALASPANSWVAPVP